MTPVGSSLDIDWVPAYVNSNNLLLVESVDLFPVSFPNRLQRSRCLRKTAVYLYDFNGDSTWPLIYLACWYVLCAAFCTLYFDQKFCRIQYPPFGVYDLGSRTGSNPLVNTGVLMLYNDLSTDAFHRKGCKDLYGCLPSHSSFSGGNCLFLIYIYR